MQIYVEIADTTTLTASLPQLLNNFKTILSQSSGTVFPTTNLQVGMPCFRTDQNKLYVLKDLTPTWYLVFDFSKTATNQEYVDGLKDASGGFVGLTAYKINFKNAANTFTSFLQNSNTAARTYTFQDRDGTIADNTDLALKANIASPTFTGTPAAPTAAVGTNTTQLATCAFVLANTPPSFPSGTRLPFNQTTAPTGWTKDTTAALNDSIMRIVTGTVGSGGSTAFSTFNGQTSVGATTLTTAQLPRLTYQGYGTLTWTMSKGSSPGPGRGILFNSADTARSTAGWGNIPTSNSDGSFKDTNSGGSHTHSITTAIKYNDFIIASKD